MLTILNLSVRFGPNRPMVDQVDLRLESGKTLAVVGETGSGKSLMGLSICNLLPDEARVEGSVTFDNQPLLDLAPQALRSILGSQISYVPQSGGLSLNPTMRCDRQVAEVYRERRGMASRLASTQAHRLLAALHLKEGCRFPHLLSGGMKQRVLVGIGLAANPDLLIADEPTKGLDSERRDDIGHLFTRLRQTNPKMAILLITHDLHLAENAADQVAVMYSGQILEQADTKEFFAGPHHPYSQALLAALPERGLQPLAGMAPRPEEPVSGCPFHPRCDQAWNRCRQHRPPVVTNRCGAVRCFRYA